MNAGKPKKLPRGSAAAFEHVLYEIEMLHASYTKLVERDWPANDYDHNCYLECCLLHTRNLEEFFFDTSEANGLMKPWHFGLPKPHAKLTRHADIGRLNAEICHLGYSRKSSTKEGGWALSLALEPIIAESLALLRFATGQSTLLSYGHNAHKTALLLERLQALPMIATMQSEGEMKSPVPKPKQPFIGLKSGTSSPMNFLTYKPTEMPAPEAGNSGDAS